MHSLLDIVSAYEFIQSTRWMQLLAVGTKANAIHLLAA